MTVMRPSDREQGAALVLGGANGIGRATVRALVARGRRVMIADIDMDAAQLVAQSLGGAVDVIRADAADGPSVALAVRETVNRFGPLDAVVHSVYRDTKGDLLTLGRDSWDGIVATGLTSAFLLAQAAFPALIEGGGGSFTVVSSIEAVRGYRGAAAYAATKAGALGLVRQLAVEYGPMGIRSNVVLPGFVLTDRERESSGNTLERIARLGEAVPLRRVALPEDVAEVVAFLASSGAAFVNGVDLLVDGGIALVPATAHIPKIS